MGLVKLQDICEFEKGSVGLVLNISMADNTLDFMDHG